MGSTTKIEWTDATWNPIIGCSRVSAGCTNCYAETIAGRFGSGKPTVYSGLTQIVNGRAVWSGKIAETKKLLDPLKWRTPKRVFVNSMSDLFHENVTDEMRDRIFAVMAHCSVRWFRCTKRECDHDACDENFLRVMEPHVFQVLTKRASEMRAYLSAPGRWGAIRKAWDSLGWYFAHSPVEDAVWPLPNVWLGVSVENQGTADERIPLLLQTPAAVRFISAEPLLGPVSLKKFIGESYASRTNGIQSRGDGRTGDRFGGSSVEGSSASLGPVVESDQSDFLCAETCGESDAARVHAGSSDDQQGKSELSSSPAGLDAHVRAHSARTDYQPHRREQIEQQSVELGTGDIFRADKTRHPRVGSSQKERQLGTLSWVICGGESGHGARPMHPDWARSLRDQCAASGVAYFFKQWGEHSPNADYVPDKNNLVMYRVGKKAAGSLLDGQEWKQFPKVRS